MYVMQVRIVVKKVDFRAVDPDPGQFSLLLGPDPTIVFTLLIKPAYFKNQSYQGGRELKLKSEIIVEASENHAQKFEVVLVLYYFD